MIDLLPCPFCGEAPSIMSVGMAGQPRWQHPVNDTCPIAGYYLGGWNFPEQWNRRALPAVQPDAHVNEMPKSEHDTANMLTLTAERDRFWAALEHIAQWSEAYPTEVFPEPDFAQAASALASSGMSIDAVSASNMRHATKGVGKIARAALKGETP